MKFPNESKYYYKIKQKKKNESFMIFSKVVQI